jgi:hypothetical protein
MKRIAMFSLFALMLVLVSGCGKKTATNNNQIVANTNAANQATDGTAAANTKGDFPQYSILVEAETGTLKADASTLSYIGESARGGEAYLAGKGESAMYTFTAEKGGMYQLWGRLSDDALHQEGARNVTVVVNGGETIGFKHPTKDTKGWEWISIGNLSLNKGSNSIVFTKDESTTAAFVMDAFKFTPILLSQD